MTFFGKIRDAAKRAASAVVDTLGIAAAGIASAANRASERLLDASDAILKRKPRVRKPKPPTVADLTPIIPTAEAPLPPAPPAPPPLESVPTEALPMTAEETEAYEAEAEAEARKAKPKPALPPASGFKPPRRPARFRPDDFTLGVIETIQRAFANWQHAIELEPLLMGSTEIHYYYPSTYDVDWEGETEVASEDPRDILMAWIDFENCMDDAARDTLTNLGCWVSMGYRMREEYGDAPDVNYKISDPEREWQSFSHYRHAHEYAFASSAARGFMATSLEHGRVPIVFVLRVYWSPEGKRPERRGGNG